MLLLLFANNETEVTDAVGITDTVVVSRTVTVTDAVGLLDSVVDTLQNPTYIDAVGITDTAVSASSAAREFTDPVGIVDQAVTARTIVRTVTDSIGVLDTAVPVESFELPSIDGSTALPGIATLELYDPVANPLEAFLPSIDGASTLPGLYLRTQTEIDQLATAVEVYGELHAANGTLLSQFTDQISVEWQDPYNDIGVGTLTVNRHDPDAGLITVGCQVYCYLYGTHVFTFVIESPPDVAYLEIGDESVEVLTASGPGRNIIAQNGLVYPPLGIEDPMHPAHRLYSFASFDYLEGGGAIGVGGGGGWVSATEQYRADEVDPQRYQLVEWTYQSNYGPDEVELVPTGAPLGWPDPEAKWIWGQPDRHVLGLNFFRSAFLLTEAATVAICVTADNFYTFYLNGTPLLAENTAPGAWGEFKRVDLDLDIQDNGGPRVYSVACVVENVQKGAAVGAPNPSGFLNSIFVVDPSTNEFDYPLLRTSSDWYALPYPASYPGWTPGEILIDMIEEAQARGEISTLQYDFTDGTDSAGNPWPVTQGFSVPVGASLLDALNSLVEQGWIDYRLAPGGLVLQAFDPSWNPNSGVTLQEGVNLAGFSFSNEQSPVNRLFVRWPDGVFQLDDAGSQAAYDIRPKSVSVDATTEIEAIRRGQVILDNAKEPQDSLQAEIAPTSGDLPYVDFFVGDRLTVPNRAGGTSLERLLALSVSHDDVGKAVIGAEFQTRIFKRERQNEELVDQLGSSVTGSDKVRWSLYDTEEGRGGGGRLYGPANRATYQPAATRGTRKVTAPTRVRQETHWSWPGQVDIVSIDPSGVVAGPPWIAPGDITIIGVTVALQGAATVDYSALLYIADVLVGTYTLSAGSESVSYTAVFSVNAGQQVHASAQETSGTSDGQGLSITVAYQGRS